VPDLARSNGRPQRIALVLAGGGARGAYEVGALSALAPALAARGESPNLLVGTSIGALNSAFFAARAHQPLEDVAQLALEMWRELRWGDALRPLLSPSELRRLVGVGAMLANLPGLRLPGLLDPAPLRDTLRRFVAFKRIGRNVEDGVLTAAAVVATSYATTRSVVFHHGGPALAIDAVRAIEYKATPLAPEHVLASAAIPGAFPAVEVRRPRSAAGWYGDGGVRLNAPLAPALALGADRVVVIGLNSSVTPTGRSIRPDAIDGVAQLLQVVLSDQLGEDVATLATVNETLAPPGSAGGGHEAVPGQRRIPYIFIAPSDRLEIGRLAREVYDRHYGNLTSLVRAPNVALLGRLVNARRGAVHGELLSYLLIAREFIDDLIALGQRDAERWLHARHDAGLWQVGRLPTPRTAAATGESPRRSSSPRRRPARRASA
jgi:NTE family protein